jgi:hypothetical protein
MQKRPASGRRARSLPNSAEALRPLRSYSTQFSIHRQYYRRQACGPAPTVERLVDSGYDIDLYLRARYSQP